MSPSQVPIDFSDDFDVMPSKKSVSSDTKRNLLLAPPSIAAHEETLHDIYSQYDRSSSDLQMLDRLHAGFSSLPPETYDLVLVLSDNADSRRPGASRLLTREVYSVVVPSMKAGAKFRLQDGPLLGADSREPILAGLVETDGAFEKPHEGEAVVPLRLGAKKNNSVKGSAIAKAETVQISLEDDLASDDELIDEDELMTREDLGRPIQQPAECQPKPGKRRRACKDCTCGLAAKLEAEDKSRRDQADSSLRALKLNADDLADELDFTVQGKTGSCNSCSLGDAFRCADCPYIGLPPFKPGEEVTILNNQVQI